MATAPPLAGIEGLNVDTYIDFRGGRVTEDNLTEMRNENLLIASNIEIHADRMPTLRRGYTLVNKVPTAPKLLALFDFQRDYDQKQFLLVNSAGRLDWCNVDGTGPMNNLSLVEDQGASFQFVPVNFACYLSNGVKSYSLLDNQGTLTLYQRGISAPLTAPTVALVGGTLTTQYGQQYAYCYVRKVTDSTGVTRYHIGPPSPLSTSTGPLTSQMVNVSSFAAPPNASWNFIWIFRTNDTPANSTSALFFLAEIPVSQSTYGDSLTDASLDLTRPIPYDNNPPIAGGILAEYMGRIVTCQGNTVQASGLEEIILGIPQETAPAALFFVIPGGKSTISGEAIFDETVYLCTKDYWFTVQGYDVTTFKKRDKILQPGAVGKKAIAVTPTHLVFLGRDRKLYAWDGSSPRPMEISRKLAKQLKGSLSMEDIKASDLENAEVRWYSFGRSSYVMVFANTGTVPTGQFDWIQLWSTRFLGETFADGSEIMLSETDFFPSDVITASWPVEVSLQTYMFLGDALGNIYRWPDGLQDNGKNYAGILGTPWSPGNVFMGPMFHPLPRGDVVKRNFWVDLQTDRQDARASFTLSAVIADSPDMTLVPQNVPLEPFYSSSGTGPVPTAARGHLQKIPGMATGRWSRMLITYPSDGNTATILRVSVAQKPLFGVVP